jgi:xanthine dehydrogenase/oxidase
VQILTSDTAHSTSMRAPGVLQSIIASDVAIEHVARSVKRSVDDVQQLNFYSLGDTTPFGDQFGRDGYNWTVPQMWAQLQSDANYVARKAAVDAYNASNKWTKRGIAISPTKYVMFTNYYSSGALVCVYGDGSVLVSHGGTEVGQGIHTKVALCAAEALGLPLDKIQVGTTETNRIPNNTCTGGSGTSECSCEAVLMACEQIKATLAPYTAAGKSWQDAVTQANVEGKPLVASSWYKQPLTQNANKYATQGVAISEVTVDVLTGEVRVERTDILMDLGNQLDAAVDIGQLQGGFMIALGYVLSEEVRYDKNGVLLNLGTWEYKIPSAYDIPIELNVSLLKDSPNPAGIKANRAFCAWARSHPLLFSDSCFQLLHVARWQRCASTQPAVVSPRKPVLGHKWPRHAAAIATVGL